MSDTSGWKGRRPRQPGGLGSEIAWRAEVMRRLAALETRASLRSASISEGGLTIKDGGGVVIRDGGQLRIVSEDGREIVFDDGMMWLRYSPDDQRYGHIVAGTAADGQRSAIWIAPPARDVPLDAEENVIIVEGRGVGGATVGNIFLTTLGQLVGRAGSFFVQVPDGTTRVAVTDADTSISSPAGSTAVSGNTGLFLNAGPSGQVQINAGGTVFLKVTGTTTVAANTYISAGSGLAALYQVSSSRRYKSDISDHHTDQAALLAARPVSWRDKAEVEADPDTTARYVGFIAEELDDLGLTEYVTYNPDGTAESVAYDRLTVGLLDLAKTQAQQIAWMAQQITALTGRVMPDFAPAPTAPIAATRPAPAPEPAPEPDPFPDLTQEA